MEEDENPFIKQPEWRKIILFNGPPRSGKSTGASHVRYMISLHARYMHPITLSFAENLKKAAHALFGTFARWDFYDSKEGEHLKSLSSGDFMGMSPREAYISLSEDYLKPKFGPEVFGFLMRKRIIQERTSQVIIMSDSGFVDELRPLVELVGEKNILIVEINSPGITFEGDSRSYIGEEAKKLWKNINVIRLPNVKGTKDDITFFRMLCWGASKKFLGVRDEDG